MVLLHHRLQMASGVSGVSSVSGVSTTSSKLESSSSSSRSIARIGSSSAKSPFIYIIDNYFRKFIISFLNKNTINNIKIIKQQFLVKFQITKTFLFLCFVFFFPPLNKFTEKWFNCFFIANIV